MGKIKGKYWVGTVGNTVFRSLDGEQIVQSKERPGTRRMAEGSLAVAARMGSKSALAKQIRMSFHKIINNFYEGKMINRLTREISAILNCCVKDGEATFSRFSFSALAGFDFNAYSPLRESLGFHPLVGVDKGILTVTLPDIQLLNQLKFPAGADTCELSVSVSLMRLKEGYRLNYPLEQRLTIHKSEGCVPGKEFVFKVPEGCLYIAAMALKFTALKNNRITMFNSKHFNPVGIIDAYVSEEPYSEDLLLEWVDMEKVKF